MGASFQKVVRCSQFTSNFSARTGTVRGRATPDFGIAESRALPDWIAELAHWTTGLTNWRNPGNRNPAIGQFGIESANRRIEQSNWPR
jgi:hypothetical protein